MRISIMNVPNIPLAVEARATHMDGRPRIGAKAAEMKKFIILDAINPIKINQNTPQFVFR